MLTQEQQWGLQYLTQIANQTAEAANAEAEIFNQGIPDEMANYRKPILPTYADVDEFVAAKVAEIASQGYQQLIAYKQQQAIELFRSKSPEEQNQILAALQVPDVLQS